jgi:hypothetical protein
MLSYRDAVLRGSSNAKVTIITAPNTVFSSASLKQKMEELEYDIIKFHLWVNEQSNGLRRRGEPVRLMVAGLFESYKLVPDDAFAKQEQNKWEDSDSPALTNEQVMTKAETKYQAIKQKGEWKVKSKKDEEIIALSARL